MGLSYYGNIIFCYLMLVRHFYINASYKVTMPIDCGEYCKVTHLVEIMFKHRRKGYLNYSMCCEITRAIVKGWIFSPKIWLVVICN